MNSPTMMMPPANKGTANIFYKTRMCARFRIGACRNGETCNFAHGIEDLRQPPSNWQELVRATPMEERERERERDRERPSSTIFLNNWDEDQKIIQRMKLCRKFCCGEECPYGERCNFLHEDLSKYREDSAKLRESSAISIGTTASETPLIGIACSSSSQVEANKQGGIMPAHVPGPEPVEANANAKTVYWKTRLCIKFEITGQCPFGDSCQFAHGQTELHNAIGRVESEAVNTATFASKPHAAQCNEASQVFVASGFNQEGQRKNKCMFKWSDPKKINRIYADWIDDLPVAQTETPRAS